MLEEGRAVDKRSGEVGAIDPAKCAAPTEEKKPEGGAKKPFAKVLLLACAHRLPP